MLIANRSVSALDMSSMIFIVCSGAFLLNALINSISVVLRSSKAGGHHEYQHFTFVLLRELQTSALHVLRVCDVLGFFARGPSVSDNRENLIALPARSSGWSRLLDSDRAQSRAHQGQETRALEKSLREMIVKCANSLPHQIYLGRSTFEDGDVVLCSKRETFERTKYHGEIVRLSSEDGSLTVVLNHADVRQLINMGWIDGLQGAAALSFAWIPGSRAVRLPALKCEFDLDVMKDIVRVAIARASTCDGGMDEESSISLST